MTNETQNIVNTVHTINDHVVNHDNSVSITEQTKAKQACANRRKKIRRGGRKQKHMGRHCSGYLKIFSTNAASVINGKQESLKIKNRN